MEQGRSAIPVPQTVPARALQKEYDELGLPDSLWIDSSGIFSSA
jgi:hypothetical protein